MWRNNLITVVYAAAAAAAAGDAGAIIVMPLWHQAGTVINHHRLYLTVARRNLWHPSTSFVFAAHTPQNIRRRGKKAETLYFPPNPIIPFHKTHFLADMCRASYTFIFSRLTDITLLLTWLLTCNIYILCTVILQHFWSSWFHQ